MGVVPSQRLQSVIPILSRGHFGQGQAIPFSSVYPGLPDNVPSVTALSSYKNVTIPCLS